MLYSGLTAASIQIPGPEEEPFYAYLVSPRVQGPVPSVVVIHHMPGWDEWSIEVTRRFAHHGYAAICPNLHHRSGPGSSDEMAQRVREAGGIRDELLLADLQASIDYMRAQPEFNGKLGVIGFCWGGRLAYLVGCTLTGVDAAVDCWGGGVVVPPERLTPQRPKAAIDFTPDLSCPLLGLFGNDDENPDPAMVDRMEEELQKHNKTYEFYRYDGAGHGFFAWDRPNYRMEQSLDGWQKVYAFYDKYLQ